MTLAYWLGFSALRPLVGPFASTLGASGSQVALIIGSQSIVAFAVAIPVGTLTDRLDARRVALGGAVAMAFAAALMASSSGLAILATAQVIVGVGALALWLSIQSLMTQGPRRATGIESIDSSTRARRIANFTVLIAVGQLLGPALGGLLADVASYPATFAMIAALAAMAAATALLTPSLPTTSKPDTDRRLASHIAGSFRDGARLLRHRPGMRATAVAAFLSLYLADFRISLLPVHLQTRGVSIATTGLLLSVAAGAGIASRPLLPFLLRRLGAGGTTMICLVPAAGFLAATVLTNNTVALFILTGAHGLALGLAQPMTLSFVSEVTHEEERGLALGVRLMAHRLAQWVGPLAFGVAATASSVAVAFGLSTTFGIPAGAAAGVAVHRSLGDQGREGAT